MLAAAAAPAHAQVQSPDYTGNFVQRMMTTGDWAGLRKKLAPKGLAFDLLLAQSEAGRRPEA